MSTGDGAYWIVTVPTGYRVDYKPWGPSNETVLGTFPSRQRAQAAIAKHGRAAGSKKPGKKPPAKNAPEAEAEARRNQCAYCGKPTRKGSMVMDEGQTAHRSCYREFED